MKFRNWINESNALMTPSMVGNTNNAATDPTVIQQSPTPNNASRGPLQPQHPDVAKSARSLDQIQNGLTNIFKRLSQKPIWRNAQVRNAFGDKITKSWSHAGQAKSILWPIGNEDDI